MVRVIIKGGVWRNTEDEVLKAAVMKYGKNQWSRVASLLHRKSAKQCKARWFEWLDPGIKKTDWSKEEDEKLLHLAKLMPTQWRTIAPIVGRTASQCLERYEHLLDQAVAKSEGSKSGMDEARRLRPGEIDPCPENKPARPDPIDMDEDELEMLSEARARLANTQGKKAKRKARERQLDEARRLAWLQKRRELRVAGIAWGRRKFNKGGVDYNADVPFQRVPPLGFHNPVEDKENLDMNSKKISDKIFAQRREKQAAAMEDKKKAKERAKRRNEEGMSDAMFAKIQAEKKRSKLVLPEPQISDVDLESIVKVGRATNALREVAMSNMTAATVALLPDFEANVRSDKLRTPMLADAAGRDTVMSEAENLLKLQNLQTPLMGGANPDLAESDFSSVLPRREPMQTPNTALKNALTPFNAAAASQPSTPSVQGSAVLPATPASCRDQLKLNRNVADSASTTPRLVKEKLRNSFMSLPTPKNDFELIPPEEAESDALESTDEGGIAGDRFAGTDGTVPDASAVLMAKEADENRRKLELLRQQSQVVQRHLPRPFEINTAIVGADEESLSDFDMAQKMIKKEMLVLMHHDMLHTPTPAQAKYMQATNSRDRLTRFLAANRWETFAPDQIEQAKQMIELESEKMLADCVDYELDPQKFSVIWEECLSQILYLPGSRRYTHTSLANKRDRLESLRHELEQNRDAMTRMATRAANLERKMRTLIGGHLSNSNSALDQLTSLVDKVDLAAIQKSAYEMLLLQEEEGMQHRITSLARDVCFLENREAEFQAKYQQLQSRLNELTLRKQQADASVVGVPVVYDQEIP